MRFERIGQPAHGVREVRTRQRRHQHRDELRAPRRQRAGGRVGHVAELLDGLADPCARLGGHAVPGDTDAVMCVSDMSAFGAIMECHRRGLAVPADVAVA
ncbi:substrate-binding domain-containing protein, partial [Burkholderia cenocepacia]